MRNSGRAKLPLSREHAWLTRRFVLPKSSKVISVRESDKIERTTVELIRLENLAVSMIFPGMDPYLEDGQFWTGVHSRLIVYIADAIGPKLGPRYVAAIEERVYLEGPERSIRPDVIIRTPRASMLSGGVAVMEADAPVTVRVSAEPIHETYIAILDLRAGQRVVTVIEVLSLSNKYAGPGRESYLAKQREVLNSDVHLVEIDLLRQGPHVLAVPELAARERTTYDYLTCVNRAEGLRDRYELYPTHLRDRLPRIRIPLADDDPDVALDVQAVVAQTYDAGRYANVINYSRPCVPPLGVEDAEWAGRLLKRSESRT